MKRGMYKFPEGVWSIEEYHPASAWAFTGSYDLQVSGVPGNPPHSGAIKIHCDDPKFIEDLLTFLNTGRGRELMNPITELDKLRAQCAWGSLGELILWNAAYHLECPSTPLEKFSGRIPSFDREWAITREPYRD